jgi:hypothetical protein
VLEDRKTNRWLLPALTVLGLAYAVYSSLPILDPSSPLFSNDEGLYLSNASNGVVTLNLRYGLFSLLLRGYFFIIHDPFWVAVLHKSLLLVAFLLFQPMLVRTYGIRVFVLLYLAFTLLNGYLLREGLIFLFTLVAVSHSWPGRSIRRYPALLALLLIRPQGLLLFLRPWLSVVLLLCFLLFMRDQYSVRNGDNGSVFIVAFWREISAFTLTTLANLNPLASVAFHVTRGEYLEPGLKVLGSIPMFAVFLQMALALRWQQYRHAYLSRLWTGMLGLLIMYGSIGLAIDKRIFLSLFTPFIIFVNPALLRWRNLFWLAGMWISMLIISTALRNAT